MSSPTHPQPETAPAGTQPETAPAGTQLATAPAGTQTLSTSNKILTVENVTSFVPVKLDTDQLNYPSWSYFFKNLCKGFKVLKHIHEDPPIHTDDWIVVDSIVKSWIFMTLSDTLQERLVVHAPKTARNAWDYLEKIFLENKRTKIIALKGELRMLQLGDLTVDAYFQKIESIATILKSLRSNSRDDVGDDDVVTYAINGLSDKYEHVVAMIAQKDPLPHLEKVRKMVTTEEMRLKLKSSASTCQTSNSSLWSTARPIVNLPGPNSQSPLSLTQAEMVELIQAQQALLAQCGFTGQTQSILANRSIAPLQPMSSSVIPQVGPWLSSPPGFMPRTLNIGPGPNIYPVQSAATTGSTLSGQDPTTGARNMDTAKIIASASEVYHGDAICQEKSKFLLTEMGLPNGLLALEDIEEFGYVKETGFVWLKQKKEKTHKFEKIGKLTTYGTEVTAVIEKFRIKKLTGVKTKELLMWITISEITVDNPDNGKITFKAPSGFFRTFPVSAFQVEDDKKDVK